MSIQKIAGRYAKSLRELAAEKGATQEVLGDLKGFGEALQNKDLSMMLKSPIVTSDKKQKVFQALFQGKVNQLTYAFFEIIIKKGREEYLPEITKEFIKQYKAEHNIVTATLITAIVADQAFQDKVKAEMKSKGLATGEIELVTEVDPSIIGGFILEIEDNIYDTSVKSKLSKVRKALSDNSYVKSL